MNKQEEKESVRAIRDIRIRLYASVQAQQF